MVTFAFVLGLAAGCILALVLVRSRGAGAAELRQATEHLAQLTAAHREAASGEIRRTVDPVVDGLERLSREVAALDRDRRATQGQVAEMFRVVTGEVGRLRAETGTLVSALKRPQVRGAWGELQLRNCVEAANMTEHVDFAAQATVAGPDGGRLRPDLVVHLPGEREVIVDAKVPMDAYLRALEAPEGEQRALLDLHGRQVRSHVDALASKAYHAQFAGSPDFVVMFIPNEAVYCAALEADPTLLEHGAAKGVLIATPTSLIALLHAVYYGWRQETIAESAREIAAAGQELHRRMVTFLGPYARLGRQLDSAVNAFNQATGSLEARVLPQLRRIEAAGAGSEKAAPAVAPLDTPAKLVTAPELEDAEAA